MRLELDGRVEVGDGAVGGAAVAVSTPRKRGRRQRGVSLFYTLGQAMSKADNLAPVLHIRGIFWQSGPRAL